MYLVSFYFVLFAFPMSIKTHLRWAQKPTSPTNITANISIALNKVNKRKLARGLCACFCRTGYVCSTWGNRLLTTYRKLCCCMIRLPCLPQWSQLHFNWTRGTTCRCEGAVKVCGEFQAEKNQYTTFYTLNTRIRSALTPIEGLLFKYNEGFVHLFNLKPNLHFKQL